MRQFTGLMAASAMLAGLLVVVPAGPASAQVSALGGDGPKVLTRRTDEEKKQDAEIDREYRATMRRSGGGHSEPVKTDPWGSVRQQPAQSSKR